MSSHSVSRVYLTCDGCGQERPNLCDDVTSARIAAALEGWKFVQFRRRLRNPKPGQQGPRFWDACSNCELPSTPEEAQAHIDSKTTRQGDLRG